MKLLREVVEVSTNILLNEGVKNYLINGIMLQGDIINGNGRKYPKETLLREVKRYNETHVSQKRSVGELDHPDSPIVNYKNASHLITRLEQCPENNCNFIGEANILNTPNGNIVKGLMEGGVKLAMSTRGVASIKEENGISVVQPDFVLNTIDIVADPSAPDAFMNGIMEGKEWVMESGIWKEKQIEQMRKSVHRNAINEKKLVKEFRSMMSSFLK